MIIVYIMSAILTCHWVADFVFQTDYEAVNKSTSNKALLQHTVKYTIVMSTLMAIFTFMPIQQALLFGLITFPIHTVQDYVTSRINAKLWKDDERHWFFVSIGLDQLLHYYQLLLTYYFISG